MRSKKNPLNDLESYRGIFMLTGVAMALLVAIVLINWKFFEDDTAAPEAEMYQLERKDDVIPITIQEQKPEKISAPKVQPEEVELVDDLTELDEDFEFATTETDMDEAITSQNYEIGEIQSVQIETEPEEEALPFAVVENPPIFPGCEKFKDRDAQKACFQKKILDFVSKNYHYPEDARTLKIEGRIFVQFVVEKDGWIDNIQVVRGVDPMLDDEAVRVVKALPQMKAAEQRGKPVRMRFVLPIKMVLK